jgi:hypothetical protein
MPLVILHHLLNVFVQLANKRGFTKKNLTVFDTSNALHADLQVGVTGKWALRFLPGSTWHCIELVFKITGYMKFGDVQKIVLSNV